MTNKEQRIEKVENVQQDGSCQITLDDGSTFAILPTNAPILPNDRIRVVCEESGRVCNLFTLRNEILFFK